MSQYALKVGTADQHRLDSQFKCYQKGVVEALENILEPGMTVVDMGCGSGIITSYLAKVVGKTGMVYALDASSEQLEQTAQRLHSLNLTNVELIQADFEQALHYDFTADVSYSSLVIEHLQDKQQGLANIANITKSDVLSKRL